MTSRLADALAATVADPRAWAEWDELHQSLARIRRTGNGPHLCLGIHLARLEMRILFAEVLGRIQSLELGGTPRRTLSDFVGGPRTLLIRYALG